MSIVNLLPEDFVEGIARRRANLLCLLLFGVTMIAVVTAVLVSQRSSRQVIQVGRQVDQAYAEAARMIGQMQELETKRQNILGKAQNISKLMEKMPRSYLMATVAKATPPGTSLREVKFQTDRITLAGDPKAPPPATRFDRVSQERTAKQTQWQVRAMIVGLAKTNIDVAKFMTRLAACPLAESVDLEYSEEKLLDKQPVCEFKIRMMLKVDGEVDKDTAEATTAGPLAAAVPAEATQTRVTP